jgi:hypothetical protein
MLAGFLGIVVGTLVTFGFLLIWDATDFMDPIPAYFVAGLIGSIGASIWPAIIAWWLVRNRRQSKVEKEVEKQLASQGK